MEFKILTHLRTIGLCVVLFVTSLADAQDLPKIVPPSPETAALFKYQDYPVDLSTGLPSINISIYEINVGKIKVPISLTYHGSGLKVTDQDGAIAVGWSLNAGGMISRTMYGSEDFGEYPFPSPFVTTGLTNLNDLEYLKQVAHTSQMPGNYKDSEYDIFSYQFNNESGKFIFKDVNGTKTGVFLPSKPFIVTPTGSPLSKIEIIDDQGNTYTFTATEIASLFPKSVYTGFTLKTIVSADKSDTITFNYTGFVQTKINISQEWTVDDKLASSTGILPGYNETPHQGETTTTTNYQVSRISEIVFNHGKVVFNRQGSTDKISSIDVKDSNNNTIKTVTLVKSVLTTNAEGNPPINKLDQVIFKDRSGVSVEKYVLEYYPMQYATGYSHIEQRFSDWWGYYNASGKGDMIPSTSITFTTEFGQPGTITIGSTNTNREPNLAALKSGVLQKITFPTGGSQEYFYENNKYQSLLDSQIKNGPGLRLSQTLTSDSEGNVITKTYKYGLNESGHGFLEMEPSIANRSWGMNYAYYDCEACMTYEPPGCGKYQRRIYSSGFNPDIAAIAERPIQYREVVEYLGTPTNNSGKTVSEFDYYPWAPAGMPMSVMHIYSFNYWLNASLKTQTVYKRTGATTFVKVKTVTNNYSINTIEQVKGLHVKRFWVLPQTGTNIACGDPLNVDVQTFALYNTLTQDALAPLPIYSSNEYIIPVGSKNLLGTVETVHNEDGSTIGQSVAYSYNAKNLIAYTETTNSDLSVSRTEFKYVFEYPGNTVLEEMSSPALNMVNFVVEKNEKKNNNFLTGTKTNYKKWFSTPGPVIAIETVEVKNGSSPYETRLVYHKYDQKSNPLSVSKLNDMKVSYIWDYLQSIPVAEVVNTDDLGIAYTSFESNGSGQWSGINPANIRTDIRGITGNKYYNLANAPLSASSLDPAKTYFISYWTTGGTASLSATHLSGWPRKINSVQDANGVPWECWEHKFKDVTSVTLSGTVYLDELRLHSEDAQMTTYTFDPLIGLQSKTDSNNTTQYFEYDDYGRLKLIRDYQRNILKSMSYNSIQK